MDLTGTTGVGLFYLAMRKGLDYLAAHPNVDPKRLGVTGLSGGGWQTITLSSLTSASRLPSPWPATRPWCPAWSASRTSATTSSKPAIYSFHARFHASHRHARPPATRCSSTTRRIVAASSAHGGTGTVRQGLPRSIRSTRTRARASHGTKTWTRPIIIISSIIARPRTVSPPGISDCPPGIVRLPVGAEVKSYDELKVGLGPDQLTMLGVARKLASSIQRPGGAPEVRRAMLAEIVRYKPVSLPARLDDLKQQS